MTWSDVVCAARAWQVSEPELAVLDVVRCHVPVRPPGLAGWVAKEFAHLGLPYSVEDYANAITACLGKGWLRAVTAADTIDPPPPWSTYARYVPSSAELLDFTEEGYTLAGAIFGSQNVRAG
jgi:hypothetical protein